MGSFFFGKKYARTRIDTPYKNVSTDELLSRFRTEEWSKLYQTERVNTFQELENRYAVDQQRPVARIVPETNSSYYGSYLPQNNVIKINMNDSQGNNSYEQLDSYYHESRHAYQSQAIKTGKGLDETTRNMCNVELSDGNYADNSRYYDVLTCEMDSNNTAADRVLERSEDFKNDPEFQAYLNRRQVHFEKVNRQCDAWKELRGESQLQMLEKSTHSGSISKKQALQLKEHIKSGENDPVVERSRDVEARIRTQNYELKQNYYEGEKSTEIDKSGGHKMIHINSGSLSEAEVKDALGLDRVSVAYAKEQNNPSANYYDHWQSIQHPETGENLEATKGYCNPENSYECYYAEYQGEDGSQYHYVAVGEKTIRRQQYEDQRALAENRNSQENESKNEPEDGASEFQGNDTSSRGETQSGTQETGSVASNGSGYSAGSGSVQGQSM